jgi:outer membrane protein OmpA-like peptidoglycan-associated protein
MSRALIGSKMNKIKLTPVLLAIAVLVGACSSMPTSTSLLTETRSDYIEAQGNPTVARYAQLEMKQAQAALEQADTASSDKESVAKVDKLAYLAKQKIAVAQEVAKQRFAEASVTSAAKERDQIRLDQRTNEADQATARAEHSRQAAQQARSETVEAQRQTQDALASNAQLEAQLADLAAKKTERGMVITLGDVLFGSDQARLTPDGMRAAQKLADLLQKNPERTVLIEGFTDSTGAASHNQALSERRATSVRSALQDMGISRDRVTVRGYGQTYPVAANDTAQNRQLNRRVEIVISDAGGKTSQR